MIFKMVSVQLPLHPKIFILGLYPPNLHIDNKAKPLIDMCLLQAKRQIALNWKNTIRPNIGQWLREMSLSLSMERITYTVRGKYGTFKEVWGPFINYIENSDVGDIMSAEVSLD